MNHQEKEEFLAIKWMIEELNECLPANSKTRIFFDSLKYQFEMKKTLSELQTKKLAEMYERATA